MESSTSGDPGKQIIFGNDAQTYYDKIIPSYKYVNITYGMDPLNPISTLVIDSSATSPIKGISYKYDDNGDDSNGDDLEPQYFIVHFSKKTLTPEPKTQTKSIDEVIKYVDENSGEEIYPKYQATGNNQITFTRTEIINAVTGKHIGWSNWTTGSFNFVTNPLIKGYTIDIDGSTQSLNGNPSNLTTITRGQVETINLNDQSFINNLPTGTSHIEIVIPYVKKGQTTSPQPTKTQNSVPPTTPTPQQPTQPTKPTQPAEPSVPTQPSQIVKHVKHNKPPKTVKHVKKNRTDNNKPKSEINKHIHKYSYNTPAKSERVTQAKANKVNNIQPKSNSINQPHHISNATPVQPHSTSNVQPKGSAIIRTAAKAKTELPQTGENQNSNWKLGLLGLTSLAIASIIALFGRGDRRRNN